MVYVEQFEINGVRVKLSDSYDNAVAESFFGSLKTELVDHEDYLTKEQARQSVFKYIELFYNQRRRHSYLDYVSPDEYERASAHH